MEKRMEKESANRIRKVEYLRILAMFAVIVNHVNVAALHIFDYSEVMADAYVSYGMHVLSRFAVPCFFSISGYLMLATGYQVSIKKLVEKSIWKYGMCILVFGTGFAWMELVFDERCLSLVQFPEAFDAMLRGKTWDHMWFLYEYLGLLFLLPVIKIFWEHATEKEKLFILISGFLLTSVGSVFSLGIRYPLNGYGICFLFGGYLHDLESRKRYIKKMVPICMGIGASVLMLVLAYFEHYYGSDIADVLLDDTSIPVLALSASLCILFLLNSDTQTVPKSVQFVSRNSFGVYLYHMVWINVLYKVIKLNPFSFSTLGMLLCIFLVIGSTFLFSVTTACLSKKIPFVKMLV